MTASEPRRVVRIVLTGPECSGKTTLAREIGEALGAPVIPEGARIFAEGHPEPLSRATVAPIARLAMQLEDQAIARAGPAPLVVRDTDLVSTVVYSRHYYGGVEAWILDEAARRLGDLYLLCAPDLPWVADGIRDRPQGREAMYADFAAALMQLGARTASVVGPWPQRLEQALAAIRAAGLSGSSGASR